MSNDCGETYCRCGECPIEQGAVISFANPERLAHLRARYPEGWFTYEPVVVGTPTEEQP